MHADARRTPRLTSYSRSMAALDQIFAMQSLCLQLEVCRRQAQTDTALSKSELKRSRALNANPPKQALLVILCIIEGSCSC